MFEAVVNYSTNIHLFVSVGTWHLYVDASLATVSMGRDNHLPFLEWSANAS